MPPRIHKGKGGDQENNGDLSKRDTVLVCVRMRPMNRKERKSHQKVAWKIDGQTIRQMSISKNQGLAPKSFNYDELWGPNTTNSDIFQKIGFNVIKTTMEGFHGVVFAYGQTSSGKTYSIHGNQDDPGMIPRSVQAIFEYINNTTDRDFLIQVSYMEIYNEVIHDLLNPTGESLNVREDPKKGVYVHGLLSKTVMSTDQIIALLALGEDSRHVGKTDYNAVSSRSHTIFQIKVESQSTSASDKVVLESKLNLVDLAGSEDTTKAGLDKKAETGNINKSLLALASVIWKISEPKKNQGHIPYRDSKLTRVLQDSLNGRACISVLCCLSPSSGNVDESISTLKFASRAKNIKNTATQNVKQADSKTLIAKYKAEIEELKQRLVQAELNKGGQVAGNVAPSQVSLNDLEEQQRRSAEEKQGLLDKIEHLNKIILKSPYQGNLASDELLSGTTGPSFKAPCRRPSYFNIGSNLGPTAATAGPPRRQSAFCRSFIQTPSSSESNSNMPKRLVRSGSLGLCDETGNEELDDLLCLPAKTQVYFEKEKSRKMEEQLSEKSEEVQELYAMVAELKGTLKEKECEISKLEEDVEDQRQEIKIREYENETYLQNMREYEEMIADFEAKGKIESQKVVEKKKTTGEIKSFKLTTGIRSRRTGKQGSESGPLIGFFLKNNTTGFFEYEGRTEWIKGFPDPVFTREFIVRNKPDIVMRFSVYDVDNEQQIDQGDFIGSATLELKTLIHQFENENDSFVEYELETESNEKAWLRIKLKPNNIKKSKSKKKNKIQELNAKIEEQSNEIAELKKQIISLKAQK